MKRFVFAFGLICSLISIISAQQGTGRGTPPAADSLPNEEMQRRYSVPIKWERYKVGEKDVSILFPKNPIFFEQNDPCRETSVRHYATYAEEIAYQMIVYSELRGGIPPGCRESAKFGRAALERTIEQLNTEKSKVSKITLNEREAFRFSRSYWTYLIVDDLKNNKFVVLSVTQRDGAKPAVEKFINSLEFGKNAAGIEIGQGAERSLGDELPARKTEQNAATVGADNATTAPLSIVTKPRAAYTDAARRNVREGSVTLKVTFLANGGIGHISVAQALPDGLTEQAIVAAKKIVFIPQIVNGEKKSVIKTVQFSFTIY